MQDALHISPEQWGWVGTVFLLGYALFEIPSGHLGDRLGARRVLTRIVIWWSVVHRADGRRVGLSAAAGRPLLVSGRAKRARFPNAAVAISNWFSACIARARLRTVHHVQPAGRRAFTVAGPPIQQRVWVANIVLCIRCAWGHLVRRWFRQFRDYPGGVRPKAEQQTHPGV